jgi:hypothetical protein
MNTLGRPPSGGRPLVVRSRALAVECADHGGCTHRAARPRRERDAAGGDARPSPRAPLRRHDEAGFYRRRYPDGLTPPDADRLEAYSWGGLTSGSPLRVLWLLLLPFTLVNVSHFMQPRELPAADRRRRLLEAVLRLLAQTLTLTLVLSVAGVVMDLAAWQCPALPSCLDRQSLLRFLGDGFWHQPGRRVALAAWCRPR